ncbi:MAG: hypothetical protein J6V72_10090 [Kiritimatiellae bacterium]|nr:hypothetical protein [Kiritimatiellia bacterium]
MSEELQKTVGEVVAAARDKYTVHECNECTWRKCCELKFDSAKCREEREDIFLSLGIAVWLWYILRSEGGGAL